MQAIPSTTALSRTAFCTSSVMSLTVSPPAVRRRVSCWNTFIVAAILRESLPDSAVEPVHPQWILQEGRGLNLTPGPADNRARGLPVRRRVKAGWLKSHSLGATGVREMRQPRRGRNECVGTYCPLCCLLQRRGSYSLRPPGRRAGGLHNTPHPPVSL